MNSLIEYEGYQAKVEFDQDDQLYVGQILGINDYVCFHGQSVDELTVEIQNAVTNYLENCNVLNKAPEFA